MKDVIAKFLSGRFTMLIIDSFVYPSCVVMCGILCIQGKIDAATFIAIMGAYALLVKETREKYFARTDRQPPEVKP